MKRHYSNVTSCCSVDSYVTGSLRKLKVYDKIKTGLKKSNPAAIVLWAFHEIQDSKGLTSRRVINFLKKHYKAVRHPEKTGKSIGAMLKCAVEFGLLDKHGTRYFLINRRK